MFKYFIRVFFRKTYQNNYIFLKDKITLYYRRFSCKFGDLKVKVFSCKFAAYFQNTFSKEHLWTAASDTSINIAPNNNYGQIVTKTLPKIYISFVFLSLQFD